MSRRSRDGSRPAWSSPSSPASTSRAALACASRTRWSSRRAAASGSRCFPRSCASSAERVAGPWRARRSEARRTDGPTPASCPARRAFRVSWCADPGERAARCAPESLSRPSIERTYGRSSVHRQFKNGMAIEIDGENFTIVEFQHVKPGKGGAFVRTKVRNIATGAVLDKTFRSGEKFDRIHTQSQTMTYLYSTDDEVVLMDPGDLRAGHGEPRHRQRGAPVGRRKPGGPAPVAERRSRPASRRPTTSSSPSRTPSPACAATPPRAAPSRPPSRPASPSRCRCSSSRASACGSTRAPAATSRASSAQSEVRGEAFCERDASASPTPPCATPTSRCGRRACAPPRCCPSSSCSTRSATTRSNAGAAPPSTPACGSWTRTPGSGCGSSATTCTARRCRCCCAARTWSATATTATTSCAASWPRRPRTASTSSASSTP